MFRSLDLIVPDVVAVGTFLRAVARVDTTYESPEFAEYASGDLTIMVGPAALIPMADVGGVILHFEVSDPDERARELAGSEYEVAYGPANTDWGTRSVLVRGPGHLGRPVPPGLQGWDERRGGFNVSRGRMAA